MNHHAAQLGNNDENTPVESAYSGFHSAKQFSFIANPSPNGMVYLLRENNTNPLPQNV